MPLTESPSVDREMFAVNSRTSKLPGLRDNAHKPRKAGFILKDKQHVVPSHRSEEEKSGCE